MEDTVGSPGARPDRRTETVRIFATADRGMAMGHVDGKVAFVPFGAPGDTVEVEVVREKKRYVQTRLVRIVEPSPLRRVPPCEHFGTCGGCQWQHLPYGEQLRSKDRSFRGFLKGRLGLGRGDIFRDPIASPREWGYRNRVGLKVREVGGAVRVGYFAGGTHRLVPISDCPIAHPAIRESLPHLERFLETFPPARGHLPQFDFQVDGRGGLWAVAHLLRALGPQDEEALRAFSAHAGLAGLFVQSGRKETLRPLYGDEPHLPFRLLVGGRALALDVSPGAFVQANEAVNQALIDEVRGLAPLYRGRPALDLFCGAGNFTLPLALEAEEVVGVEGYPPAARDGERNARANGFSNIRILPLPAERGLRALATEGYRPVFALLDPPREGAEEALGGLAALAPEQVLYVSCSPPTLARDLRHLAGQGYRVEWIRAADMFPQTAHLESLTLLSRSL